MPKKKPTPKPAPKSKSASSPKPARPSSVRSRGDGAFTIDPRVEASVLNEPHTGTGAPEDLGCGLQGPSSRLIRRALEPFRQRLTKLGATKSLREAESLVRWLETSPGWDALTSGQVKHGRRLLRSEVLYGDPAAFRPRWLHLRRVSETLEIPIDPARWPALHGWWSYASRGASRELVKERAHKAGLDDVFSALESAGFLCEREEAPVDDAAHDDGLWFIGHNTLFVSSGRTRVIVDPWLRPWRDQDPDGFRPLRACDFGHLDAICITHSHGDHFHLGSLLHFDPATPVLVPLVERESVLATDLVRRLKEIGFTDVRAVPWWSSVKIGDTTIEATPFYGEQANAIELVEPSLRNVGNTWVIRTPHHSVAALADTGRDPAGQMLEVGRETKRRTGAVDTVFGGMRGFSLFPLFLAHTTLDAMFVNVPLDLLTVRQRLMHDGNDLLATSEAFGATRVVPYADGGAPWYLREGMGPAYKGFPAYPGESDAVKVDRDDPHAAPFPERLEEFAETRYGPDPFVEPLILRPGDLVRFEGKEAQIGNVEGFAWPYED